MIGGRVDPIYVKIHTSTYEINLCFFGSYLLLILYKHYPWALLRHYLTFESTCLLLWYELQNVRPYILFKKISIEIQFTNNPWKIRAFLNFCASYIDKRGSTHNFSFAYSYTRTNTEKWKVSQTHIESMAKRGKTCTQPRVSVTECIWKFSKKKATTHLNQKKGS